MCKLSSGDCPSNKELDLLFSSEAVRESFASSRLTLTSDFSLVDWVVKGSSIISDCTCYFLVEVGL